MNNCFAFLDFHTNYYKKLLIYKYIYKYIYSFVLLQFLCLVYYLLHHDLGVAPHSRINSLILWR